MTLTTFDNSRLIDKSNDELKEISQFIESQFPSIYREEGIELINLVSDYYRFLETNEKQNLYNIRKIYEYRNIDTTLSNMLLFFKNKYMDGLYLNSDIRFILKHILDLYRRKGSKESIELFFRLFFKSEIDIYFPTVNTLRVSNSKWIKRRYLRLFPTDPEELLGVSNKRIYGSQSGAEAFIENVYFVTISKITYPIIFIDEIEGEFAGFDSIFATDISTPLGVVYGSLTEIEVDTRSTNATGNNSIGDIVDIISPNGYEARGRVSEISKSQSAEVIFNLVDGGYGYTLENTDVLISNQTILFDNQDLVFEELEKIKQTVSNTEITATVIGQNENAMGILLDNPNTSFTSSDTIETINRSTNISITPLNVSAVNSSASADIKSISNTETIFAVIDLIQDFLSVQIDSTNWSDPPASSFFSGSANNTIDINLSSVISDAFEQQELTIGEISDLKSIDGGADYGGDVFIKAVDSDISKRNIGFYSISTNEENLPLIKGDVLSQTYQITDFNGSIKIINAKAEIISIDSSIITVKPLSFYKFISSDLIYKINTNTSIEPTSISSLESPIDSRLGSNASITGFVENIDGKISKIDIIDSGIGYLNNETVTIKNTSNNNSVDGSGSISVRGVGFTEGEWTSKDSNLIKENRIHDSHYYQDFSYEISSALTSKTYEKSLKELVHVSGTKLFSKFISTNSIRSEINITSTIGVFDDYYSLESSPIVPELIADFEAI